MKAQNIDYRTLPFKSPLAPYLQWAGILIIFFILGCEFYLSISPFGEKGSAKTFFANYLGAPLFIFDFVAYKVSRLHEHIARPQLTLIEVVVQDQIREAKRG